MDATDWNIIAELNRLCRIERARLEALGLDRIDVSDDLDYFEWKTEKRLMKEARAKRP